MHNDHRVVCSPLHTTILLLQPAVTCSILPCFGKSVTEQMLIHPENRHDKSEQIRAGQCILGGFTF